MRPAARVTDAISHGGEIIAGSPTTRVNGLPQARLGDAVHCVIHGLQSVATASPDVTCDGIPAARLGDLITCTATIVTGSPDTAIN